MSGIGEIIFLVLVLGIVGLQQFLKKKKQKEQRERQITVNPGKDSGETLRETWKSLFAGDDPFDFGTTKPVDSEYITQRDPAISSGKNKYHQDGKYRGQPIKSSKGKPVPAAAETGVGNNLIVEETEANAIIKDFDIRKAIIYTEIMTPKFKE